MFYVYIYDYTSVYSFIQLGIIATLNRYTKTQHSTFRLICYIIYIHCFYKKKSNCFINLTIKKGKPDSREGAPYNFAGYLEEYQPIATFEN